MAQRLNNPGTRHFDANGDPLSGGKLYFYKVGTTTKKDTYSDNALSTPNANPVILDSGGLEPDIYLSGAYRVILDTSNDVQVWDRDHVNDEDAADLNLDWDGTTTYSKHDIVQGTDGALYYSLADSNLGNDPVNDGGANWDYVGRLKWKYEGSKSWDPGTLADDEIATTDVSIPGVEVGDLAMVSHEGSSSISAILYGNAEADAVKVILLNVSGGSQTFQPGTLRVVVTKQ